MTLKALHVSLLMEADRHGSVCPVTQADWNACEELLAGGYIDSEGNITEKGRATARRGER